MNKRKLLTAAVLSVLVICIACMPAYGYFTANTRAKGKLIIEPINTRIDEGIADFKKEITITNNEGGAPVYVRARGFAGDDSEISYTAGDGWFDGGDGWWYYSKILNSTERTTTLTADISKVFPDGKIEIDDSFNVVVVYESVRPETGSDGKLLDAQGSFNAFIAKKGE